MLFRPNDRVHFKGYLRGIISILKNCLNDFKVQLRCFWKVPRAAITISKTDMELSGILLGIF